MIERTGIEKDAVIARSAATRGVGCPMGYTKLANDYEDRGFKRINEQWFYIDETPGSHWMLAYPTWGADPTLCVAASSQQSLFLGTTNNLADPREVMTYFVEVLPDGSRKFWRTLWYFVTRAKTDDELFRAKLPPTFRALAKRRPIPLRN